MLLVASVVLEPSQYTLRVEPLSWLPKVRWVVADVKVPNAPWVRTSLAPEGREVLINDRIRAAVGISCAKPYIAGLDMAELVEKVLGLAC